MQKYLVVNDVEVSYRSFTDEELIVLFNTTPDTALITTPFGVLGRLVNKFANNYSDFIRETVFDYDLDSVIRVFVNVETRDGTIYTRLASIKDCEGTLTELPSLPLTTENANVFARNLYEQIERFSKQAKFVEIYADKMSPFYVNIKTVTTYDYTNSNISIFGVTNNGLARDLISNPEMVKIDWAYLSPQSFVVDEPDFCKDKGAYTKHMRLLAKELRDKIFSKYEEVKDSLDTPQIIVTEVDTTVDEATSICKETEQEEKTKKQLEEIEKILEEPIEIETIEELPSIEEETHEPVFVEINKSTETKQEDVRPKFAEIMVCKEDDVDIDIKLPLDELNISSEPTKVDVQAEIAKATQHLEEELRKAKIQIKVLESQLADNEELHKQEVESLVAKLNHYEKGEVDLVDSKVNSIEIERLTEQLVRLTQVETKYKELRVDHEELCTTYTETLDENEKLHEEIKALRENNQTLVDELNTSLEDNYVLKSQLAQDTHLSELLAKVSNIENLVQSIDSKVDKSAINVVKVEHEEVDMTFVHKATKEYEEVEKRVSELLNEKVVEPYEEEEYESEDTVSVDLDTSYEEEEEVKIELDTVDEFEDIDLPELPTLSGDYEELPSIEDLPDDSTLYQTEEERDTFDNFFDNGGSLGDYLRTKTEY